MFHNFVLIQEGLSMNEQLTRELGRQLAVNYGLYSEKISRRIKAACSGELSEAQYLLLRIIADSQRIQAGELGARALMHKQQITRLLNQLEQRGLIVRVRLPEDRRAVWIEATDAARAKLVELHATMDDALTEVLGQLDEPSLRRYLAALTTINDILDAMPTTRSDEGHGGPNE